MSPKQLVRLSNTIGVISIFLLIYWIFTFIVIQVFELKVFRENLTEAFYMSVFGILALMGGALIVNIMFNLTRIAEKHNQDELIASNSKRTSWAIVASFPLLLIILFGGDYLTSMKKESFLVESAKSMTEQNLANDKHLLNYSFEESWIIETKEILEILSKTDKNFSSISILVKDSINGELAYLSFNSHYYWDPNDNKVPSKIDFIRKTTHVEREYLNEVFKNKNKDYRYSAHDGTYELFYPYYENNKTIVIYFAKYDRYGKIGS